MGAMNTVNNVFGALIISSDTCLHTVFSSCAADEATKAAADKEKGVRASK